MKSAELFWNVIAQYHQQTIWIQIIMISIGIGLTVLLYLKPAPIFQSLMKGYLAASFAWMSIVFFWGMDGSPLSLYFVGPLFLLIAVFFLADIRTPKIHFVWPKSRWQRAVSLLLFVLVLAYPLASFLLGHRYPALSTPFLPCPLTVFALALLSAALPHIDRKVYILLLVWAMMALPKVFGLFNVREDTILFLVGLYSLVMLILHWQDTNRSPSIRTPKPTNLLINRYSPRRQPMKTTKTPYTCPWWLLFTFDNPIRKLIHNPRRILKDVVQPGDVTLDVGCGMGYFSLPMAELVGPQGKVIAADLQEPMLAGLHRRAQHSSCGERIQPLLCSPDRIGLIEPLDFALAFWMVHEVRDQEALLKEIHAALKVDGKFLMVEPRIHVPSRDFKRTVELAERLGFKVLARPSVMISRAVVLGK